MPGLKTEITELATGLGMLGVGVGEGLATPPPEFLNVDEATWSRLASAFRSGAHDALFENAWANGRAFLSATDGLRGRLPRRVEWKGPDRQVEADPIPADLRVDHVYLVSIKTRSDVLANRSPARLFLGRSAPRNWFLETAPDEYRSLYRAAVTYIAQEGARPGDLESDPADVDPAVDGPPGTDPTSAPTSAPTSDQGQQVLGIGGAASDAPAPSPGPSSPGPSSPGPSSPGPSSPGPSSPGSLSAGPSSPRAGASAPGGPGDTSGYPDDVEGLTAADGKALGRLLPGRSWPEPLRPLYLDLARAVSAESARRWNGSLASPAEREQQAWRLLRLAPAPYFVLGTSPSGPLRIRVDTPWDWRRSWEFLALDVRPAVGAGQPQVDWTLRVRNRATGAERVTEGFVEVRWSHGRFSGAPEAKVQLRSRHEDVPGYTPLT